ncbi:dephospho-CoA kinase [Fluviicola taffensis]|uniref:Dephospho-CoA kinase n=1 Tax=Fluviicola taffensis (strain DSM 16823 / NCIMB 13979 / RW262) TaxID=755732 RepID=F2IBE3_FLUTR|nr:dephospho-CoA kinase [Fluviicola taffensis]AEA44251.1 Dephospho-CoA kinase [Fluviicola taffensis DSM 16823]
MTKVIGITGGIGSGKSVVSKILQLIGYPVYSSDQRAKEIMHEDQKIIQQLTSLFGNQAYLNKELNRPFIASQIFQDDSKRIQMNQIVHPAVRADFKRWTENQVSHLVFQESALLFETGNYKAFDGVILVTASEKVRLERIKLRDNLSEKEIRGRFNSQMLEEEKKKLTPFVIYNNGDVFLVPQILDLLKRI